MKRRWPQESVEEFHEAFDIPVVVHPLYFHDESRLRLRRALITEEYEEWEGAAETGDLKEMAKELADLVYVILGTYSELGIDFASVFEAVHVSNMSKLWPIRDAVTALEAGEVAHVEVVGAGFARCHRADGKVLKPPTYLAADLSFLE